VPRRAPLPRVGRSGAVHPPPASTVPDRLPLWMVVGVPIR
jgi:hypothetical protein